ncbi:MAG: TlpA family protein disulfide reductase [Rubrivivax sp.]|nr:TlpA family protein disulfide reductase [Rubrivivax sp.]
MRFDLTSPGAASPPAPPWATSRWFNLPAGHDSLALDELRGRVIVLHTFQMLCPGCVFHGLPQAQRIAQAFAGEDDVAVIGLHTVFEHHAAMTPVSLEAFLYEHRIRFPVGVDAASEAGTARDPLPQTMRRYALQGTPSLVLIDRAGRLRRTGFGAEEDLGVGAAIATLLAEPKDR